MDLVNYIIVNNEKLIVRDVSGNGRRTRYSTVENRKKILGEIIRRANEGK